MAPALREDRFTAARLSEGVLHGVGGAITDASVQNPSVARSTLPCPFARPLEPAACCRVRVGGCRLRDGTRARLIRAASEGPGVRRARQP